MQLKAPKHTHEDEMRTDHAVAILGAGAWGTALACAMGRYQPVYLWCRCATLAAVIHTTRENTSYLPGILLPDAVTITTHLSQIGAVRFLFLAVPVAALSELLGEVAAVLPTHPCPIFVLLSKGFEPNRYRLPGKIFVDTVCAHGREACAQRYVVLSGPSFAYEVARNLPTYVLLAGPQQELSKALLTLLSPSNVICSLSQDHVGLELAGAVKNILAIAAGLCDGLELGQNARAALLTVGIAEMVRFAPIFHVQCATMYSLAGLGDILLTATGYLSRNRQVGLRLGRGEELSMVLESLGHVAEGVHATYAIMGYANAHALCLPFVEAVYNVLMRKMTPRDALLGVLAQPSHCDEYP